jgi:hypothetical protein
LLPQAQSVFDDTATLDAAVDLLDAAATMIENLVSQLLLEREGLATGFSRRHEDLYLGQRKHQKVQLLQ